MNNAHAAALAIVVIGNWMLAHVATSWAMPSEVQSSFQTLVAIWLGFKWGQWANRSNGHEATSVEPDLKLEKKP